MEEVSVEERVREVAARAAEQFGVELVHAEISSTGAPGKSPAVVRVFIDKPGGVTHEDCARVSEHVGTVLDVEDFMRSAYTLEVSSPGLERGLYKREDYERFAGQPAKMRTREALNGQRNFRGRLVAVEGDEVVFDDRTNGRVRVPLGVIAKANLEIDVEEEFRRAEERERQKRSGAVG